MEWKIWKYKKLEVGKVLLSFGNFFFIIFVYRKYGFRNVILIFL